MHYVLLLPTLQLIFFRLFGDGKVSNFHVGLVYIEQILTVTGVFSDDFNTDYFVGFDFNGVRQWK